jgi:hypothetical protein
MNGHSYPHLERYFSRHLVIAAFADFEEKPAWGAIRAALLENQLIDHQYGHSTDD